MCLLLLTQPAKCKTKLGGKRQWKIAYKTEPDGGCVSGKSYNFLCAFLAQMLCRCNKYNSNSHGRGHHNGVISGKKEGASNSIATYPFHILTQTRKKLLNFGINHCDKYNCQTCQITPKHLPSVTT